MGLFRKKQTSSWYELAAVKIAALSLGVVIGAAWPQMFYQHIPILLAIVGLAGLFVVLGCRPK